MEGGEGTAAGSERDYVEGSLTFVLRVQVSIDLKQLLLEAMARIPRLYQN